MPNVDSNIGTVSLEGFTAQPNLGAAAIERRFGIQLQVVPPLIEDSWHNRRLLIRKMSEPYGFKAIIIPVLTVLYPLYKRGAAGTYNPEIHAIIVKSHTEDQTIYHETAHAYIGERNPEVVFSAGNTDTSQRDFILNSFNEGLAQWMAIQTLAAEGARKRGGSPLQERILANALVSLLLVPEAERDMNMLMSVPDVVVNKAFLTEHIQRMTERYMAIAGESTLRRQYRANSFNKTLSPTVVGINFVHRALQTLIARGFGETEAINLLIDNPPVTLEELIDPSQFFTKVADI